MDDVVTISCYCKNLYVSLQKTVKQIQRQHRAWFLHANNQQELEPSSQPGSSLRLLQSLTSSCGYLSLQLMLLGIIVERGKIWHQQHLFLQMTGDLQILLVLPTCILTKRLSHHASLSVGINPFTKENASHLTGYLEWYTATAIKFPYYQVKLAIHGVGIPEK